MPAEQRGSVYKTARGFGIRWRDETRRQAAPVRASRRASEARAWFRDVERKRMRGETSPPPP